MGHSRTTPESPERRTLVDRMVGLRLTDGEHESLSRYAAADRRAVANLARLMVQSALAQLEAAERNGHSPAAAVAALTRREA